MTDKGLPIYGASFVRLTNSSGEKKEPASRVTQTRSRLTLHTYGEDRDLETEITEPCRSPSTILSLPRIADD